MYNLPYELIDIIYSYEGRNIPTRDDKYKKWRMCDEILSVMSIYSSKTGSKRLLHYVKLRIRLRQLPFNFYNSRFVLREL